MENKKFLGITPIDKNINKHKALFALWSISAYTIFALSIKSFLNFDQLFCGLFLESSAYSLANALNHGILAEDKEKELNALKNTGRSI